jgi:AraC family transcriptional regulator
MRRLRSTVRLRASKLQATGPDPTALARFGEATSVLGKLETATLRVEEEVYAAGLCIPRHAHTTSNFVYIVAGTHWSGHRRGGDICAAGTVRFLPAGEPHENYFPVSSRCVEIQLQQSIVALAAEHGQPICSPGELAGPSAKVLGARLYHEFCCRDDVSLLDIESVTLQLLLIETQHPPPRRNCAPPWLLQVREMIREDLQTRVTLAGLCRCVGRHPVHISREFHRHFRCTISEYLRRVRIAKAQSLLASRNLEVADIALACGFSDQSHFTNEFRRMTGVPPYRYRLQIFGARRSPAPDIHSRSPATIGPHNA